MDALERKYGGQVAREAAVRIQRAFRAHRLHTRFKTIALQALRHTNHVTAADAQSTRSDDSQTTLGRDDHVFASPTVSSLASSLASSEASPVSSQQQLECQRKRQYRVGLNLFNKQ